MMFHAIVQPIIPIDSEKEVDLIVFVILVLAAIMDSRNQFHISEPLRSEHASYEI